MSCVALLDLATSLSLELKNSSSQWDGVSSKARKLAVQLTATAASFGDFIESVQSISDSASHVRGATRDVGASLTRFCLRQKRLQSKLQTLALALGEQFSATLEKKGTQWKERLTEIDKRRRRRLEKKKSAAGKGRYTREDQAELRNDCEELLLERRARLISFVSILLPLLSLEVDLLDDGDQLLQVRDSIENIVANDDPRAIILPLLEDICKESSSDHTPTRDHPWREEVIRRCVPSKAPSRNNSLVETPIVGDSQQWSSLEEECGRTALFPDSPENNIRIQTLGHGTSSLRSAMPAGFFSANELPGSAIMIRSHDGLITSNTSGRGGKPPIPRQCFGHSYAGSYHQTTDTLHQYRGDEHSGSAYSVPKFPTNGQDARQTNIASKVQRHPLSNSTNDLHHPISYGPQSLVPERRRNARPLSLTEKSNSAIESHTSDAVIRSDISGNRDLPATDRRASSSLIAETLDQIDKLGDELDSFCRTLKPLNPSNVSSGVGSSSTASLDYPQTAQQPQTSTIRFRPNYIRPPPPIPERRNSTISCATPTAPSIAEVRGSIEQTNGQYIPWQ